MKISIFYSKENEINNVKEIFNEKDWYLEHNYKVYLPNNLSLENPTFDPTIVSQSINDDYKELDYQLVAEFLKSKESWLSSIVEPALKKIDKTALDSYEVYLTKYGVGGGYELPNKVGLDIKKDHDGLIKTLVHEIIHLSIEEEIARNKVGHFNKERVVDLLTQKLFPEITKTPKNMPEEAKKVVDPIFNENYPDIEKILSNVSAIRGKSST